MEDTIKKADILIEALPYVKKFRGKIFVIKYGGSVLSKASVRRSVLEDIVFLNLVGVKIILVHGGGPNISNRLKEFGIKSEFYEGIRVTNKSVMTIVQKELGVLNKTLESELRRQGVLATGMEGSRDIIYANQKESNKNLGFVGEVTSINKDTLNLLLEKNHIIVLSPTAINKDTNTVYNINADEVSSFISGVFCADKLVLLTNVEGIFRDFTDRDSLVSSIHKEEVFALIHEKKIQEGMIPKVLAGLEAIHQGVKKVHIIDAKMPHGLLLEIFTNKGIGTEIVK